MTGRIDATHRGFYSTFETAISRDIYDLTAQALDNHIRYWTWFAQYTYFIGNIYYFGGKYTYYKYSDGNHINYATIFGDVLLRRKIASGGRIPFNPRIDLRYDIIYQNAGTEAELGYFSGKDYLENRWTMNFIVTNGKSQPLMELVPTCSYVTYNDNGKRLNTFFFGGSATFYMDITSRLMLIAGAKAGRYPFAGPNEYKYQEYALRLLCAF